MKVLHLITARGGSKGLPGKNIKELGGKPLFMYSVEFAKKNMGLEDKLCISTDDTELIALAKKRGVNIDFKRPDYLSSDSATSYDVILHAINFFEEKGEKFDAVMLLQPTSPFRNTDDYNHAIAAFQEGIEMSVSVKQSKENPYFTLFEEDDKGFLHKSKQATYTRRQDCPDVYAYNGSIYLMNISALKQGSLGAFTKIKKFVMPAERSVDIDTMVDWVVAEHYLPNHQNS